MNARRKIIVVVLAVFAAAASRAQFPRGGGRGGPFGGDGPWNANEAFGPFVRLEGGAVVNEDTVRTAREIESHSTGTPTWTNPKGFEKDVFTFARVVFRTVSNPADIWNYRGRLGWWVDFPDADLNFSYRLQQLTSMRVDPDGRVLRLTDPDLADYPVIFTEHVENMSLPDRQVEILRRYLLNGGALFIVDFWNSRSWANFEAEMKRVLPGRAWTELSVEHPMFHCVFDLKGPMKSWQVPTIHFWNGPGSGPDSARPLQWRDRGPDSDQVHVRTWLDDKGRIMVIVIHNSDMGDGWEREGENDAYFHTFSEKIAYPLGVNVIFYLMTH
jgi:hypothetical protein